MFLLSVAATVMQLGCGRRLDPSERNVAPGTLGAAPRAVMGGSSLAADQSEIRQVDSTELFDVIRRIGGKGVALNVWASWCGPCQEELPMLRKVAKAYERSGITVLPLSVDDPENQAKAAAVLRGLGFAPPYYVAKSPIEPLKQALWPGWPGNIPVTFLFDSKGARRYFFTAEVYEKELTPKLDALISGTLETGKSNFGVAEGLDI